MKGEFECKGRVQNSSFMYQMGPDNEFTVALSETGQSVSPRTARFRGTTAGVDDRRLFWRDPVTFRRLH